MLMILVLGIMDYHYWETGLGISFQLSLLVLLIRRYNQVNHMSSVYSELNATFFLPKLIAYSLTDCDK